MYSIAIQPHTPHAHQAALQRLQRSLTFAQGQFAIILVQVSSPLMRQWVTASLAQMTTLQLKELVLHPSVTDLFGTIQRAIAHPTPQQALSVVGLNNLDRLEAALQQMNFSRDRFQQEIHTPMIWWIDDQVRRQLRRAAPDFTNCLTAPIQFITEGTELFRMQPPPKLRQAITPQGQHPQTQPSTPAQPLRSEGITYSQPQTPQDIPALIQVLKQEKLLIINLELLGDRQAQRSLEQLSGAVQTLGGKCQNIGANLYLLRVETRLMPTTATR